MHLHHASCVGLAWQVLATVQVEWALEWGTEMLTALAIRLHM